MAGCGFGRMEGREHMMRPRRLRSLTRGGADCLWGLTLAVTACLPRYGDPCGVRVTDYGTDASCSAAGANHRVVRVILSVLG